MIPNIVAMFVTVVLAESSSVDYYLYLKESCIQITEDNATKLIKNDGQIALILPGWNHDHTKPYIDSIFSGLEPRVKYRIAVDYSKYISHLYFIDIFRAARIAEHIKIFLSVLINSKIPPSNINLIGYSFGAQLSGIAAQKIYKNHKQKISSIIALDPASLGFISGLNVPHLSRNDAMEVGVIHTSLIHGNYLRSGTWDVYVNGGISQPGCNILWNTCSHGRSVDLFIYALMDTLLAAKCSSYRKFVNGKCQNTTIIDLGQFRNGATGKFYLTTNDSPPFRLTP